MDSRVYTSVSPSTNAQTVDYALYLGSGVQESNHSEPAGKPWARCEPVLVSDCVLSAVSMEPLSSSDLPPTLRQVPVRGLLHSGEGAVHTLDAVGGLAKPKVLRVLGRQQTLNSPSLV